MASLPLGLLRRFLRCSGLLPRFHHFVNRVHPTFESLHPANLKAIQRALREGPSGDNYEFGVYKGFSLWFATCVAEALGRDDMLFHGFDSFDGLPAPIGVDERPDAFGNTFARGCFCAGRDLVERFLASHGADMSRIRLVKGFFGDVLPALAKEPGRFRPASVVLIDCDMYSSTKEVLAFLPGILQVGTILLFDDWLLTDADCGQRKAYAEWAAARPSFKAEPFCDFTEGKGFKVIHL